MRFRRSNQNRRTQHGMTFKRVRFEVLEERRLLAVIFSENFDSPILPGGLVYFDASDKYDGISGPQTGGSFDGNVLENGYIRSSYFDLITADQSGSGYFLHHRTGGGGVPFNGTVWGTDAPVAVVPNVDYTFTFFLTSENGINDAKIQPIINGDSIGPPVVPILRGAWQRVSVNWSSGDATTADLSLYNVNTGDGGNDFGIDSISFSYDTDITLVQAATQNFQQFDVSYAISEAPPPEFTIRANLCENDSFESCNGIGLSPELNISSLADRQPNSDGSAKTYNMTLSLASPAPIAPPNRYVLFVADAGGNVTESDESNNVKSIRLPPIAVNVVTHGYKLPLTDPTGPFRVIANTLDTMPSPGTALDGRVRSFVPSWDSSNGWNQAFVSVLASFFLPPSLANLSLTAARNFMKRAAHNADAAAHTIVGSIVNNPEYLIGPDFGQVIHLIGHSRGAAVNARVSRLLNSKGYAVDQYSALDGFSKDWPDLAGLILGDISIVGETRATEKVNYLVESALSQIVFDWWQQISPMPLRLEDLDVLVGYLLNWKAPERAGFDEDPVIPGTGGLPSNHFNIHQLYAAGSEIEDNYIGDHRFDTVLPAPNAESGESESEGSGGGQCVVPDVVGGNFDDIGSILRDALNAEFPPEGNPVIDYWRQIVTDPAALLVGDWNVSGTAQLVSDEQGSLVELVQTDDTAIAQPIIFEGGSLRIEFDLDVRAVGENDRLDVLLAGETLGSIDLARQQADGRHSLVVPSRGERIGEVVFRLAGPADVPSVIRLDNIEFVCVDSFVEGDTNFDGLVDIVDLNNVRNNFGATGNVLGDANGDGSVDIQDLNAVRNNFGAVAPSPVPLVGESQPGRDLVPRVASVIDRGAMATAAADHWQDALFRAQAETWLGNEMNHPRQHARRLKAVDRWFAML